MRSLCAFMKKEWMEQLRSGKFTIILILFTSLGIMNPAIAKLTPWLLETMSDSLAQSGMTVTNVEVSALDSWMQFFKNAPMGLMAFVILESSIFTREYQQGTLIQPLTKGLERYKVVISKAVVILSMWTFFYWLSFGITYGYNAYFWDNTSASNLFFSILCWWITGLWAMALSVFFASFAKGNTVVLTGVAGTFLAAYVLSLWEPCKKFSPALLMDGTSLIYNTTNPQDYMAALAVTAGLCVIVLGIAIKLFSKKQL